MRELRAIEMSDMDRLGELWALCFTRGELWDPIPEDMLKNSEGFLIEEDGRICGSYANILFDMHHDERIVPIGGVSVVATALADRGTGVAQEMMRHCITRTREIGRPASMLYAFSLSFYRALGYEVTGRIYRIELPLREIPRYEGKGVVRQVEPKPGDVFNDIYSKWAHRYRGTFERRPSMWERHFHTEGKTLRFAYVYEDEDGPQGFMQFRFNDPAWENGPTAPPEILRLRDFVVLTPDAHRALLGTLSRFDMQCKKVRWNGPADDYALYEPYEDMETVLVDQPMMRATDIPALLATPAPQPQVPESLPPRPPRPDSSLPQRPPRLRGTLRQYPPTGAYAITVDDFDWAGGTQTYTVVLDEGQPTVTLSSSKGDPGLAMSQRSFIRCWVGDPDAVALRTAGHIEVNDEEQFDTFCAHFPRGVFCSADGF